MEDMTPVDESSDEMEDYDDRENDFRNMSRELSRNSTTFESKKSPPRTQEMFLITVLNKALTSLHSRQMKCSEVLMQSNRNELLLQRQDSDSISSGASRSRERSEVGMDLNAQNLNVHGQPSTSSHQQVTSDGLAGDRFSSSSGVTAPVDARGRVFESNTSSNRISKYISNARELLFTILEEMMKFKEEQILCSDFRQYFLIYSERSYFVNEAGTTLELLQYLGRSGFLYLADNGFQPSETSESCMREALEVLTRVVVGTLITTVSVSSSLSFDSIMINYKTLKDFCERYSQFLRDGNEDKLDEDSRNRVVFFKNKIERLLLQTRNAFKELLMHIGEHAERRIVDSYEGKLWVEDKSFLRRRLL